MIIYFMSGVAPTKYFARNIINILNAYSIHAKILHAKETQPAYYVFSAKPQKLTLSKFWRKLEPY